MKKLILFLSIIISFSIIFGQASSIINIQQPMSFRSQALGGTVDDDLDLIYDPIELKFVSGIRLYTNLSNLINSYEYFLDDVSNDEFLAGISLENPFIKSLWNSVLVQYRNDRNPIVDYAKEIDNNYYDSGGDGLIDTRSESMTEQESYSISKKSVFILNNSYEFGDLTFGLKFETGKESIEGTSLGYNTGNYGSLGSGYLGILSQVYYYNPSFSNSFDSYMVGLNNFRTLHWDETGDFLGKSEFSHSILSFSAMKPFYFGNDTTEVRADLQYIPIKTSESQNDAYSGRVHRFDRDIPVYLDTYEENESLDFLQEIDGSLFALNVGIKQVFKNAAERKNNGFWELNAGLVTGSGDYTTSTISLADNDRYYFDGMDTLNIDYSRQQAEKYVQEEGGDISISSYYASFRINLPLGDRVHVGAGVSLISTSTTVDIKYTDTYDYSVNYEILDDSSDASDYTTIGNSTLLEDRTYEEFLYNISIPAGIEYKFTNNKKWSLRFGSIFNYTKYTMNIRQQNTKSEPYSSITQPGDGSEAIISDVSQNRYFSTSEQVAIGSSSTTYVYGLGFQATENLQIDLLGYLGNTAGEQILDTTFFRHLRLSFTLKF